MDTSPNFQSLPESVHAWLISDQVTNIVIALNEKYKIQIKNLKVVPVAISKFCRRKLAGYQLVGEIKNGLNLAQTDAEKVVAEIKAKILNPAATDLKSAGIKLEEVPGPNPISIPGVGMAIEPPKAQDVRPGSSPIVNLRPAAQPVARPTPPALSTSSLPPSASPYLQPKTQNLQPDRQPFMLHEEAPSTPPPATPGRESFSFHVPVSLKSEPRPAPAKFGASFEQSLRAPVAPAKSATAGDTPKVVHYHNYRSFPALTEAEPKKPGV